MTFPQSRHRQPEKMDQPGLDNDLHHGALRTLARINRYSGTIGSIWRPIREHARRQQLGDAPERPLRILDVACGGGDLAIGLAKRAKAAGLAVEAAGCDISQTAIDFGQWQAEQAGVDVRFLIADVLGSPLPEGYDVICSSLFLHHLDEPDVVRLLRGMGVAAQQLIVISDLLRTRLGYWLAWGGCHVLTRNPIVHFDGPVSVEGAFSLSEILGLTEQAGLDNATLRKRWPERFLLTWTPQ